MPCATSPSAIACTSSGCMPQKSAICVKVNAVFSISHTAVAFGINGNVIMAGYDARSGVGQVYASGLCWVDARETEHAMMDEEEGPVRKRTRLERIVLDTMGIEELR